MSLPPLAHLRFHAAAPMPVGRGLLRGWRHTVYEAAGAAVRLGRRAPRMDALLRRAGAREAAFVGAWNPFSRKRPRAWNEAMLGRLRACARRARIGFLEGSGSACRPDWREDHLLLFCAWRRAAVLARRFRQHALLRVRRGAPSRLLVLR